MAGMQCCPWTDRYSVGACRSSFRGLLDASYSLARESGNYSINRHNRVRYLGLSNVSQQQLAEAQRITERVCVQNFYHVAHPTDDGFIDGSRAISN